MCKTGFIQKYKGSLWKCKTINEEYIECHYENDYPKRYYGFKRKRRFSYDKFDNGYLISEDGTCHHCSSLGFTNCKNCGNDKACISCDDVVEDGIGGCEECQSVNNEPKCILHDIKD